MVSQQGSDAVLRSVDEDNEIFQKAYKSLSRAS